MKTMIFGLMAFFALIPGLTSSASAGAAVSDLPQKMAELIYFNSMRVHNGVELAQALPITPKHREEVISYLRRAHVQSAPIPKIYWKAGSSLITVTGDDYSFNIDFSLVPGNRTLLVNSRGIALDPKARFSDVLGEVRQILKETVHARSGMLEWLVPEAEAGVFDRFTTSLAAGFSWITGTDQITACQGEESSTVSQCVFRSNASMILADSASLDSTFSLTAFSCSSGHLVSAAAGFPSDPRLENFSMSYDSKGNLTKIATAMDDTPECVYEVKDNRVASVTLVGDFDARCTHSDPYGTSLPATKPVRPGSKLPDILTLIPFPVNRGESCCQSQQCQSQIQAALARNSSSSGSGNSQGTAPTSNGSGASAQ
ncbi:MAG: hypothetical protein P4M08_15725 [Oligoflexia bacterium]|nr:hypothetical protein [Oligoflexia bacterium]